MTAAELVLKDKETKFSFELLPPLKGNNIDKVFKTIDTLKEFNPQFINITSHREEYKFAVNDNGYVEKKIVRKRPGTVAVAASIQNKYGIKVIPHIISRGFTKSETEYALIDLNFMGIHDILVLRGDDTHKEKYPERSEDCNQYAIELAQQVNDLNKGIYLDGTSNDAFDTPFAYGVAGYPEKHEEAPNMDSDLAYLKAKVDAGAEYVMTQMFFDNQKYFDFVDKCRAIGITVPIIPGIKPITTANQLTVLPKIFSCEIPEDFAKELRKCKDNDQVKQVGVEWCIQQSLDLKKKGVPIIHFYTMMATQSTRKVAEAVY
ncbi:MULTISPECIES: methylenetetrahydrofolate reductase [NAD(P)H] [unclassified Saccharicrinis]|uniref:methylenetetrahydrofolate reductase [NAD(P)H] n=1 Tax=unclassified Saccharicrinis TaxID=2646859 RepID=UPI003D33A0F0